MAATCDGLVTALIVWMVVLAYCVFGPHVAEPIDIIAGIIRDFGAALVHARVSA